MRRYVFILLLVCFIFSGCAIKNDNNHSYGTENETVVDESQRDTSQSSLENSDQSFIVDKIINGVAFKLGEENSAAEQTILKIDGSGSKNSNGDYSFQGIFKIDGKEYHLIYESNGGNLLSYSSPEGYVRTFGQVFINDDFTFVSICILEDGWSNEDGSMLTYPGDTKEEGLEIANKVMEEYLLDMEIPKLK